MPEEEPTTNVDGITSAPKDAGSTDTSAVQGQKGSISSARFALIAIVGVPYFGYMMWSIFLLSVLPDASGKWESIIPLAKLVAMIFGIGLGLGSFFAVMRIGKTGGASDKVRYASFARIGLFALPGIAMSAFVPYWIAQEPSLPFAISAPPADTELVAPLSISYSAETATSILKRRGLSVKLYKWDLSGNGEYDQETVTPDSTGYYDRQGGYNVSVTLELSDGSKRTIRKRIVIPKAVFSYSPFIPVIDEEIVFSVEHLVPEERYSGTLTKMVFQMRHQLL